MKNTTIKTLLHTVLVFISLLSLNTQAGIEITYIYNDALGTPVAGADEQGNVKWRAHYQPYGEELLGERQLFGVRAGYTGQRADPETGLTYMGARYYSPTIGRFMGIDPAGVNESNLHSFNRYVYANNNPYKFVDLDGENAALAACVAGPVGCGVGIAITIYAGFQAVTGTLDALRNESADDDGDFDEVSDGDFSEIEDITEPGSIPNIRTNVPKGKFEDNLVDSGFEQGTSRDGKVKIFTKGNKKFTTRDTARSTGGPSADVFKDGDKKSKIRLGD